MIINSENIVSAISSEELALIGKFARKELKEEEIYTFSIILCDNEIDRDGEKFTIPALKTLAELFVGKTGIFDHNMSSKDQTARIYATEFVTDEAVKTSDGEPYSYVKAKAYMLRTEKNRDLIAEIDAGIKKETSVGCSVKKISCSINEKTQLVTIQRSKGYAMRPTFSVQQIGELIAFVKEIKPDVICMVDNCYGEFVDIIEPSDLGADMIVGSLIKNPGGGLAPIGGYICGKQECIDRCAYRLSAPGLGQEVGASLDLNRALYQGFFLSPTVTAGALKGAIFAANIYEKLGFRVIPNSTEPRHDIIQAVELGSGAAMEAFCQGIQAAAPVDSYVTPIPYAMPGYTCDVIMAAGAFIQGSSIELSADGPIREPYSVYFQGGLTWFHAKTGILMSLQKLYEAGLVNLNK